MDKSDCRKDVAADEMAAILGDNKEALILDLGAGIGIVGKYVRFIFHFNIYVCKYGVISLYFTISIIGQSWQFRHQRFSSSTFLLQKHIMCVFDLCLCFSHSFNNESM